MYQFIHIETYARQASTKQKPSKKANATTKQKQNVSGIISEAVRDIESCPHVTDPQPPIYLIGDDAVMRKMEADIEHN